MVDALRAALRLLPAVRPSVGGISGACSRVPKARIHSASEQSTLLALKVHPQITNREKVQQGETGITRFARAVLAYVGAGFSAVTANQLVGPSILQAKELGSVVGGNHTIAASEAGGMWQRNSATRHMVQEDGMRSPKFSQCLPHIAPKSQADTCHLMGHSYYWSWGSVDARFSSDTKLDQQWQFSPSTHRDYRSKLGGLDESQNTRFSKPTGLQALAAESNSSVKGNPGLMVSLSDYHTTADLELEWQLIVDPKAKSGLATPMCDSKMCEEEEEVAFEEAVKGCSKQDEPAKNQQVFILDTGTSELLRKSNKEVVSHGSRCADGLDKNQVDPKDGAVLQDMSGHHEMSSKSSMKAGPLRRTTDKEASAALVAQRSVDLLENCDLPTQHTRSMSKASLSSFDISPVTEKQGDMSRSLDKNLLASLLHGNEPSRLENLGLPSSTLFLGVSEPIRAPPLHVSQPLIIPSTVAPSTSRHGHHSSSADNRNTRWNGGAIGTVVDRGLGLLGEALCHSQTRAREAEKKVQEANEEKEKLVRLFFREASLSLTYRHWVSSLQAENMWLRMYARNEPLEWLHCNIFNPFSAVESFSNRHYKNFGQDYARRQMEHYISAVWNEKDLVDPGDSNDIMMGCKLGFAFALGLSLAGAGLMLGWSMGWIFLACSVSM